MWCQVCCWCDDDGNVADVVTKVSYLGKCHGGGDDLLFLCSVVVTVMILDPELT